RRARRGARRSAARRLRRGVLGRERQYADRPAGRVNAGAAAPTFFRARGRTARMVRPFRFAPSFAPLPPASQPASNHAVPTLTNDLVQLARSLQLETLEKAWAQQVQSPKPAAATQYIAAIDALCDRDMQSRAVVLAAAMVDALAGADSVDAAIELATRVLRRGAHNAALARNLVALFERPVGSQH